MMTSNIRSEKDDVPRKNLHPKNGLSEASLTKVKRSLDTFRVAYNKCISLSAASENPVEQDMLKTIEKMREGYAMSTDMLRTLHNFLTTMEQRMKDFRDHTNQIALNYGLGRLPDELLSEILFHAATKSECAVTLSHVCKRFRAAVLFSKKTWAKFPLCSNWAPKRITAAADRSGVLPLEGHIDGGHERDGIGLAESSKNILSLSHRLDNLQFSDLTYSVAKEVQTYTGGSRFPTLHTLHIFLFRDTSAYPIHFYDSWKMPALREVYVNFIPLPMLGRSLVRCFLALSGAFHPEDLLEFLSSANLLQRLTISVNGCSPMIGGVSTLCSAPLPCLDSFGISFGPRMSPRLIKFLAEKIRLSVITKLQLSTYDNIDFSGDADDTNLAASFRILHASPLIRDLKLQILTNVTHDEQPGSIDFDAVLRLLPRGLETLSFATDKKLKFLTSDHNPEAFKASSLRHIRFHDCKRIGNNTISSLHEFFQTTNNIDVNFEFERCSQLRSGTYTLDSLRSARSLGGRRSW